MKDLRPLTPLRYVSIIGQCTIIAVAEFSLDMDLPLLPMLSLIGIYTLIQILIQKRERKQETESENSYFAQLVLDVFILSGLLYFAGGGYNPFVSLLLLPLIITATSLSRWYASLMAIIVLTFYSLLMVFHQPMPETHLHSMGDFDIHVFGMWFSFLLGVALIVFYIVKMAEKIRERDQALSEARQAALQDQHLVALGTFATGAAHELGTPLATMAIIANELSHDESANEEQQKHALILKKQIERCKSTLTSITARAGYSRAEGGYKQSIDNFLDEILQDWRNLYPATTLHLAIQKSKPVPEIVVDATLCQALVNLLNNAAQFSPDVIKVSATWNEQRLLVEISDEGPGFPPELLSKLGKTIVTTKEDGQGLGVGLFLVNAVFDRLGGSMELSNSKRGGAIVKVKLPLVKFNQS